MFIKTNIPETTLSLEGVGVDFGDMLSDHSILNDRTNKIQVLVSGNRCGHSPDAPRFFRSPTHHKRRPAVLDRAIDQWEEVYWKAKKFFTKLATSHTHGRQVRSERREAVATVSQVLLHYLELSTLRVGFYIGLNKFIHLDIKYIAKKANLSFSRAKRAITALSKAGYIKITRQHKKKEDGTFAGEPSIREIAVQFFIDLGIDVKKLFFARDWKRKKEEKTQAKETFKKLKGVIQAVTSFSNHIVSSITKRQGASAIIDQDLVSKALLLYQADSSRSPSDYLKELQRLKE